MMVTTPLPARMDWREAERICRMAPDSGPCQRAREQHAAWQRYLDERRTG